MHWFNYCEWIRERFRDFGKLAEQWTLNMNDTIGSRRQTFSNAVNTYHWWLAYNGNGGLGYIFCLSRRTPPLPWDFTGLHNNPSALQDHCGRCRIRTKGLCSRSLMSQHISHQWATTSSSTSHHIPNQWAITSPANEPVHPQSHQQATTSPNQWASTSPPLSYNIPQPMSQYITTNGLPHPQPISQYIPFPTNKQPHPQPMSQNITTNEPPHATSPLIYLYHWCGRCIE